MFLPVEPQQRLMCEGIVEKIAREEGLTVLGWRDTPVNGDAIGRQARATQPYIEQVFLRGAAGDDAGSTGAETVRRPPARGSRSRGADIREKTFFYVPSMSSRTIVYKGLLLAPQIAEFYKELSDPGHAQLAVHGAPAFFDQHISRPGSWRIRIDTSATTARSTRCAAT